MKTVGTESSIASARAVIRLVAPGPLVATQTPTLPDGPCEALGGVAGGLFVAGLDVAEVRVDDRVVHRQVRPAGDPEDVLHALGLQ